MLDLGLNGTNVLVTGANGGIGLETTKLFLEQGANVVAHHNSSDANLKALPETATSRLITAQADLKSEDAVRSLFDHVSATSKSLDPIQVLVVNHAIYSNNLAPIVSMSLEQWNNTLATNLTASFLVVREFLRRIEKAKSERDADSTDKLEKVAIVLVGSTAGKYGEADHGDYAASKSAMMYGFLLSLKNEIVKIAPHGRINCVAPGWVKTPMAKAALENPETIHRALATTPMLKFATPVDVANQIVLLSSPVVSGHVSGQVVMVEGGMEGRQLNTREEIDKKIIEGL